MGLWASINDYFNPTDIKLPEGDHLKNPELAVDQYLGQASINVVVPPIVFLTLGKYAPSATKAILNFFGPDMPKFLPTINVVGMSALGVLFEKSIAKCFGIKKTDKLVHTPIPGVRPFMRSEALSIVLSGLILQTVNGILQEYDPNSEVEDVVNQMLMNGAWILLGQFSVGILAEKVIRNAPAACSSLWQSASSCWHSRSGDASAPLLGDGAAGQASATLSSRESA